MIRKWMVWILAALSGLAGIVLLTLFLVVKNRELERVQPATATPVAENPFATAKKEQEGHNRALNEMEKEIGAMGRLDRLAPERPGLPEVYELEAELEEHDRDELVSSWEISAVMPDGNQVQLHERITVSEPVEIDSAQVAAVATGDRVELPLPEGVKYTAVVQRVQVNGDGETSWNGYVEGYGTELPVTFTIGEESSYATVTTPEGLYTMETFHGSGWVYKTPDPAELADPDQPDRVFIDLGGDKENQDR